MEKDNVLKNKNFLLLFQGKIVSNLAATLYSFALSFYILEITNNNSAIQGLYLGLCGIVYILMSFIGGILADRWNKIKIIYGSDFIKGFILILSLIPLIIAINTDNSLMQVILLFAIGIINNIIAAIFSPAASAILPEIVEEQKYQQANSYFSIASSFEAIFGIVLAGILYSALSIQLLFIVVGVAYIISGVTEVFIKTTYINKKNNKLTLKSMFIDLKDAFKYLWPRKGLMALIFGILFINFFFNPYFSNAFPYIIKTSVSESEYLFDSWIKPEMWSSIFSVALSLGSLYMSIVLSKMKQRENNGKWIKLWLFILAIVALLVLLVYYIFINSNMSVFLICNAILFFAVGLCIVSVNIPISTTIQKTVEKDKLAKVSSLINIGSQGLIPIASLVSGLIISNVGVGVLLIVCTVGMIITAIFINLNKSINNL